MRPIQMVDLKTQYQKKKAEIDKAVAITRDVKGVTSVQNNITIKADN